MHDVRLSSRSDSDLRAELARIQASSDPAGPLFGSGYQNYKFAAREIGAELASRRSAAPAGSRGSAVQNQAPRTPAAQEGLDIRSRSFADKVYTARKTVSRKASMRPAGSGADVPVPTSAWASLAEQVYGQRRQRRQARLDSED